MPIDKTTVNDLILYLQELVELHNEYGDYAVYLDSDEYGENVWNGKCFTNVKYKWIELEGS